MDPTPVEEQPADDDTGHGEPPPKNPPKTGSTGE